MVCEDICRLAAYGIQTGLITEEDRVYTINSILEVMGLEEFEEPADAEDYVNQETDLEEVLNDLLDFAAIKGILPDNTVVYRDLFDTKLMGTLVPRPHEVAGRFRELYSRSPKEATDYYYKLSQDSD